jgi:hypothetical protein
MQAGHWELRPARSVCSDAVQVAVFTQQHRLQLQVHSVIHICCWSMLACCCCCDSLPPQVLASQVADRAAKEQHEKQEELEYAAQEQVSPAAAAGSTAHTEQQHRCGVCAVRGRLARAHGLSYVAVSDAAYFHTCSLARLLLYW